MWTELELVCRVVHAECCLLHVVILPYHPQDSFCYWTGNGECIHVHVHVQYVLVHVCGPYYVCVCVCVCESAHNRSPKLRVRVHTSSSLCPTAPPSSPPTDGLQAAALHWLSHCSARVLRGGDPAHERNCS